MEIFTLVNGVMVKEMEKEFINHFKIMNIKVVLKIIKEMVQVV